MVPLAPRAKDERRPVVDGILSLLHWVAGVSYSQGGDASPDGV